MTATCLLIIYVNYIFDTFLDKSFNHIISRIKKPSLTLLGFCLPVDCITNPNSVLLAPSAAVVQFEYR